MRRKPDTLLPLEVDILSVGIDLLRRRKAYFHGFLVAKSIRDRTGARSLTAYGTLYKALDRLERAGYLESQWEQSSIAEVEHRPRRRLYRVTAAGKAALATATGQHADAAQTPLRSVALGGHV